MTKTEHHIRVTRRARYYTLGESSNAHDIWLVCHGYAQLAERFINNFDCISMSGRVVVAPEALQRFYLDAPPTPAKDRRVGATWMTRVDRENDIADYVDYLDTLVSEYAARAPHARVRVLGFSQGTSTVLRWAVRATRAPDDLILWAGEVPADVNWNMGAGKLGNTRIYAVRGRADRMTSEAGWQRNLATLSAVGLEYQMHSFDGGHHLDEAVLCELAQQ